MVYKPLTNPLSLPNSIINTIQNFSHIFWNFGLKQEEIK